MPELQATNATTVPMSTLLNLKSASEILRTEADLRHMLGMVASTLGDQIAEIEAALARDDVKGAHAVVHQLKGFLPVFCTASLADELAALAALSREGSAQEVGPQFARVRPMLVQFDAEVKAWLAQAPREGQGVIRP